MKTTIFLFLIFLSVSSSQAQETVKFAADKPFLGMKGKVKTLIELIYDLDATEDSENPVIGQTNTFEFSEKGALIKKTISYEGYEKSITYMQFENVRPLRFEQKIKSKYSTDKDSTRIYIIDHTNERLVTWSNYNHEYASVDTSLIYYYDNRTEITPLGKNRRLKIVETRDRNGNLINETKYLRGKMAAINVWEFDDNNLMIRSTKEQYNSFFPVNEHLFFSYQNYDAKGNWLLKITTREEKQNDENDEIPTIGVIERKIEYY